MATVELEGVSKIYPGGARGVTDCTLRVEDGECVVVVGPSGCGKSTVLRLVAGLEEPTAGTLRIGGRVVNDVRPQDRNVAMVFQEYALYPHLTARRNLEFPLRMRGLPRADRERQVEHTAAMLDIGALLDRLPRQLSGGQRQRVAMGRALVRQPSVFLLDEPLSNLDPNLRVQVRAEIKELQRRTRTTMLYVTHDQVEAMTLGDRVAVLSAGRLQQVAPPGELYAAPANAFVAGFIGNPPMNLFPSHVTRDGGGRAAIVLGDSTLPLADPDPQRGGDAPITAGIRPEALRVTSGDAGPADVRGTVEHLEFLGHETLVHVTVGAGNPPLRLVARIAGLAPLARGATVGIAADPAAIYLFDEHGARLPHAVR